jgi:hypothetical protein
MSQDFYAQTKLDVPRLRDLLAALYGANDASERWDQGLRITRVALSFVQADAAETKDADVQMVAGLALVFPVRQKVVPTTRVRASVEAFFVSQGWTAVRSRELMRALERLPDKPQTIEEKIVADAETLTRLGVLGLVRSAMAAGAAQQTLTAIADTLQKNVHRRLFTRAGSNQAAAARDRLRDLAADLRKIVETEGAAS